MWVRELKRHHDGGNYARAKSHPVWVRELKPKGIEKMTKALWSQPVCVPQSASAELVPDAARAAIHPCRDSPLPRYSRHCRISLPSHLRRLYSQSNPPGYPPEPGKYLPSKSKKYPQNRKKHIFYFWNGTIFTLFHSFLAPSTVISRYFSRRYGSHHILQYVPPLKRLPADNHFREFRHCN